MPRYRVTAKEGAMLMGAALYAFGDELEWKGWPTTAVEPVDEPARRIFAFWKRWNGDSTICGRFAMPHSPLLGGFYLPAPAVLGRRERDPKSIFPSTSILFVPKPAEMFEGMPAYELKGDAWYGGEILTRGSLVTFLGWPDPRVLEPANDEASRVAQYFDNNHGHPQFVEVRGPWCEFARAVVLPDLPAIAKHRPQGFDHNPSVPRSSHAAL